MKPDIYIYILVMAGVTYLIRIASPGSFQAGDHQSFCEIVSVLCALRLSGGNDFSGDPDGALPAAWFRERRAFWRRLRRPTGKKAFSQWRSAPARRCLLWRGL